MFVERGCRGCGRAMELVTWARGIRPELSIKTIDLGEKPEAVEEPVFAVPAYFYRGRPVFVGNPSRDELRDWLISLQPEV